MQNSIIYIFDFIIGTKLMLLTINKNMHYLYHGNIWCDVYSCNIINEIVKLSEIWKNINIIILMKLLKKI